MGESAPAGVHVGTDAWQLWARRRRRPDAPSVLIVEDDELLSAMYGFRLQYEGINVSVAHDGEEALSIAASLPHDLILMDLALPKKGGLEVMRALRADPHTAQIPMAVLSNYDEPEQVQEAEELGVVAYLLKARTTPTSLVESIQEWLVRDPST